MKKTVLLAVVAAAALTSCSSIHNTATTKAIDTEIYNRTSANLTVSDKVASTTIYPTKAQRRAGERSMKAAAITKCLEENGGDILVAPQFEVKKSHGLFGSKIVYIKVSGHPATYVDFHPTSKSEAEVILIAD